jgi:ankyrin repeat protein
MRKSILRMVRLCLIVCSLPFFFGCKEKPIHHAAYDGDLDKVKKIIEKLPNQINVQDAMDFTPLHLASGKGHTEIVEFLLNHGADTELETCTGHTPMMLAAWYAGDGKYETIKTLLEHGAKVNHKEDGDCSTALHYAAMYSGKEVINLLISYGADVNARDEHHSTPLHQAAMLTNIEAAKALVEHGADIFAKNYYDYSKPLPDGRLLGPPENQMNKTAKEIALSTKKLALSNRDKEMIQYLQKKEEEKEQEKGIK